MICPNCGAQLRDNSRFCSECAHPVKEAKKPQHMMGEFEPITGLSLDYVAYRSNFHFSLLEKDGVVLFSCNYFNRDSGEITQEDVPVDPAYLRELGEFVQKNDYVHLIDDDPSTRGFHDSDEPYCALTLIWEDYETLSIHSTVLPPNGDMLKEFFIKIAEGNPYHGTQLVGYWANISRAADGIAHLEGFYFAEDGTGLIFHPSEGCFLITAYGYSDDGLFIRFLNMEDAPAEWLYQIESVHENRLVLSDDNTSYAYERMSRIEPNNSLGGYTVTQVDGVVFEIIGYL